MTYAREWSGLDYLQARKHKKVEEVKLLPSWKKYNYILQHSSLVLR